MNNAVLIEWDERLESGIRVIDEQHRGLVAIINSVFYLTQIGFGDKIINDFVLILKEYTKIHFFTEESLMKQAGSPLLDEHIGLHKELRSKLENVSHTAATEKDTFAILSFLKEWWLQHIAKDDHANTIYLRKLIS